jgi:hypothetical protein
MRCPSTRGALHRLRMIRRMAGDAHAAEGPFMFVLECAVCGGRMKLITDIAFATELGLELPMPAAN